MAEEKAPLTTIDQAELDKIIARHEAFRMGRSNGAWAQLAHYDLSRLNFANHDLSHADFTGSVLRSQSGKGKTGLLSFLCLRLAQGDLAIPAFCAPIFEACLAGASMAGADLTGRPARELPRSTRKKVSPSSATARPGFASRRRRHARRQPRLHKNVAAVAINSNFEDANLSKSVITHGDLRGANPTNANLSGADLSHCELRDVNLRTPIWPLL